MKNLPKLEMVIEEVKSHHRFDVINMDDKDEDDRIPLKEMLFRVKVSNIVPLSNPIPISFTEPKLELRDEDLKDKEFQMDEAQPNPGPIDEVLRKEDLNIDWNEKESVEDANRDRARVRSDDEGVGHMFGSQSELNQRDVYKIVKKFYIPDHYTY